MQMSARVAIIVAAFGAVTLSAADRAWATPITYNEATDGELAGQNIGAFDVGSNTVAGSESFTGLVSFDQFLFEVPAGLQLDSIVLSSFSGVSQGFTLAPPGPIDTATRFGFLLPSGGDVGTDLLPALLLSDPGKTATAPLPAGTYQVVLGSVASTSYQYTFNLSAVQAVPEPATLGLLAIGAIGACRAQARAKRRRQQALV